MNREIEFRGKRIDNNEWVYGNLIKDFDNRCFIDTRTSYGLEKDIWGVNKLTLIIYEVIPKTVGQYVGAKDKNGNKIYEDDIVKGDGWDYLYLVVFENCKFITKKINNHNWNNFTKSNNDLSDMLYPIRIGNKFDNPELLKEGE